MKSFIEEFQVDVKKNKYVETTDYETFPNKILLDELRNKIIQNLIDNRIDSNGVLDDFIKKQVDAVITSYSIHYTKLYDSYNMIIINE